MRLNYNQEFTLPMQKGESLRKAKEELERSLIRDALEASENNVAHAAKLLNTGRTTVLMAIRRLKIQSQRPQRTAAKE